MSGEKRAFCPDYCDFVDIWLSRCYNTNAEDGKIFMKTKNIPQSTEKIRKTTVIAKGRFFEKMINKLKKFLTPVRVIALGFAAAILLGSLLLTLPLSLKDGVRLSYIDALYTSTSAVCVTGLISADAGDTFSYFGQTVLMLLIQIGGLGVTVIGAGVVLAIGKHIDFRGINLIKEGMNLDSAKDVFKLIKSVFITTITIELFGAALSFITFSRYYSPGRALFISLFHSIAAFNNSGFDILGGGTSLISYNDDVFFNIVTSVLIILGGIGFPVIREVLKRRFAFKKLSMHSKIVLTVNAVLLITGTLLLKITENITWLGAFFMSVSSRTAGFSSYNLANFTNAGLFVIIILMFIGASPGSTGGGIKTTTLFVLLQGIKKSATNRTEKAFKYSVPRDAYKKASVITLLGISVSVFGTYLMLVFDPGLTFMQAFFEIVSAFGTAGLSLGITSSLSVASKLLSILIMFIGRLGPMTIATLWSFQDEERARYPYGNISIG